VAGTVDAGAVDGAVAAGADLDVGPVRSSELPLSPPQPATAAAVARAMAILQMRRAGAP